MEINSQHLIILGVLITIAGFGAYSAGLYESLGTNPEGLLIAILVVSLGLPLMYQSYRIRKMQKSD
ncbi:hypothetical protein [Haladaptatus sp. CMAA 1911]|uniref:hypothetical protein n=1 Tax=unclassified Haladaptatus TaxID=2622732 RepID=UPI00375401B0